MYISDAFKRLYSNMKFPARLLKLTAFYVLLWLGLGCRHFTAVITVGQLCNRHGDKLYASYISLIGDALPSHPAHQTIAQMANSTHPIELVDRIKTHDTVYKYDFQSTNTSISKQTFQNKPAFQNRHFKTRLFTLERFGRSLLFSI